MVIQKSKAQNQTGSSSRETFSTTIQRPPQRFLMLLSINRVVLRPVIYSCAPRKLDASHRVSGPSDKQCAILWDSSVFNSFGTSTTLTYKRRYCIQMIILRQVSANLDHSYNWVKTNPSSSGWRSMEGIVVRYHHRVPARTGQPSCLFCGIRRHGARQ